ncbi:MAG: lipase family protein [Oscillospiraceae bacterium]|nr:lipase family protein [Oscillospiraceae bacterium]
MNRSDIIKSLELSTAAYRDIQPYTPHVLAVFTDERQAGVKYFLRKEEDVLYITFRGTDEPRQWLSNFRFSQKTIPYDNVESKIKVHTGFLNSYKNNNVRGRILNAITGDMNYIKVSGHSRGAALAVLCAVDIQYNFPDRNIETVLFGCPRVGNKAFVKSYNKRVDKTIRVENGNDVVTKVPPAIMGYRHVGAKLHTGFPEIPLIFSADDHYPHEYYSSLLSGLSGR